MLKSCMNSSQPFGIDLLSTLPFLLLIILANLVSAQQPPDHKIVKCHRSGNWSDPTVWDSGSLPANGDNVLVPAGVELIYDVQSESVIRVLKIAGVLRFANDRNTRLNVGLVRIEPGEEISENGFDCDTSPEGDPLKETESVHKTHSQHHHTQPNSAASQRNQSNVPILQVGHPNKPIDADVSAKIRLVYCEGMDTQSCPAIVCCGGRMDLHGAPMARTWLKFANAAKQGDRTVTLAAPPQGWRVGDRLVIPTTDRVFLFEVENRNLIPTSRDQTQTEECVIESITGNSITLRSPLQFDHLSPEPYMGEAANLSRNVVIESADPDGVRGHTMYHALSSGSISYAEFRHLGKKGLLGRYPIHFHLCRNSMRGSYVIGASVHDSDNRWLTVHGTDYLVVRDCVGYNALGHGYFLEDGTEVFNVFDRNLAVQARHAGPLPKQMLPYDENEGAGFWWANSLNTFTRNVAAECDQYGYRFEATSESDFTPTLDVPSANGDPRNVDVRTLPFVRFQDNEAHSHRRFALNLGGIRHVSDAEDHRRIHTPGSDLSRIQGGDVQGVGPDTQHPFVIKDFRVWNSHWVFHGGSPNVLIDGLHATDCTYGIFKTRMDGHEYRRMKIEKVDTAEIFQPWGNTSMSDDYHRYLDPTDDLPPSTIITHSDWIDSQHVRIHGTTSDNGSIEEVLVNGKPASAVEDNYAQWEIVISAPMPNVGFDVDAVATDGAGNKEQLPHRVGIR